MQIKFEDESYVEFLRQSDKIYITVAAKTDRQYIINTANVTIEQFLDLNKDLELVNETTKDVKNKGHERKLGKKKVERPSITSSENPETNNVSKKQGDLK